MIWPGIFYVALQTFVLQETGSGADAGMVMGSVGLGALAGPVFGGLADRFRAHRPIQLLSFGLMAVSLVILAFAEDETIFVLSAILFGVFLAPALMMNTVYAVGSGLSKEAEARAIAWLQRLTFAGQIVGGLLVAGMIEEMSFRTIFLITAGISGAALVLTLLSTGGVAQRIAEQAAARATDRHEAAPPGKLSVRDLLGSAFGLALLVIFLNHLGWVGVVGQYTNYFKGAFDIEPSVTSTVNSLALLASLLVIGFAGTWMGKAGPTPVAATAMAVRVALAAVLAVLGWLLAGVSGALVLPLGVWVALRLVNPLTELSNPVLAARTSPVGVGLAQAMMTAAYALAITVGNVLGGQIAENFGWEALPWQTVGFCLLAFGVTHFLVRPRLREGSNEPDPEMLLTSIEMEENV